MGGGGCGPDAISEFEAAIGCVTRYSHRMSKDPDVRWQQRLQSFGQAFERLSDGARLAGERELSPLEKQGLIQAFEFTHELAWNVLKDYLENQGIQGVVGSKGATREAFKNNLISEGEVWMDMIKSRNQTTHTYNEKTANEITEAILTRYCAQFSQLQMRFARLQEAGS
jgi:nucleotidyltransferase substrate binding protein (TIGR01987 family)